MSTRLRSVLAAALASLLAVAVLGAAVDVLVERHLHASLERSLHARAVEIAQLSASAPALVRTPGALDSPVGATQAMVEIVDRRGRIVARSLALGGRVLPRELARQAILGHRGYASATIGTTHLRVYFAPLADVSGRAAGGGVLVAASTNDVHDTVRAVRAFTLVSALAASVVGALAVWVLVGRALRPLSRLDKAAEDISRTGDPSRRLPLPPRADEVGRLAETLNAMLATLERTRENERRFVADASHELRTPLTALRGNVEQLARHGPSPDLVADLQADAARLTRLTDDLLALSREESASPPADEVDLAELAHASDADDVEGPSIVVRGDRDALERALANLVENARRHGAGRVSVTTAGVDGRARLEVADEGRGVPAEAGERVFERFEGDGSGLGLAIVRATAERHGGTAYVHGARFTIELPIVRKASERSG